ncbi:hypothetical protein TNCV_3701761 [Trichonephila clavipes]|nr:hypothetical protein TNCV_3701761 [Trichonephila clavipes]
MATGSSLTQNYSRSQSEIQGDLHKAFSDKTLSGVYVFEWHKRFSAGRDNGKNDEHARHPRRAITDQSITKVRDVIWSDQRLSAHAMRRSWLTDREAVRRILTDELHMRKICEKVVPKILGPMTKSITVKTCVWTCYNILQTSQICWNLL